jgi:hypothetical protein
MKDILHINDCFFGKTEAAQLVDQEPDENKIAKRQLQLKSFSINYARAYLSEQVHSNNITLSSLNNSSSRTETVILYTDESYVHTNHHANFTWMTKHSKTMNVKKAKGRRLILIHAMSKYGLLSNRGQPGISNNNVITAELIEERVQVDKDYHNTIDHQSYMGWINNHFIPACKQLLNKRICLMLDNAGYHKHGADSSIYSWSKTQCAEKLIKMKITRMYINEIPIISYITTQEMVQN